MEIPKIIDKIITCVLKKDSMYMLCVFKKKNSLNYLTV